MSGLIATPASGLTVPVVSVLSIMSSAGTKYQSQHQYGEPDKVLGVDLRKLLDLDDSEIDMSVDKVAETQEVNVPVNNYYRNSFQEFRKEWRVEESAWKTAPAVVKIYRNWYRDVEAVVAEKAVKRVIDVQLGRTSNFHDTYYHSQRAETVHHLVMTFDIPELGMALPISVDFSTADAILGLRINKDLQFEVNGKTYDYSKVVRGMLGRPGTYTRNEVSSAISSISIRDAESVNNLLLSMGGEYPNHNIPKHGIQKIADKMDVLAKKVFDRRPIAVSAYRTMCSLSKKSVDSVKISSVFNEIFGEVETEDEFLETIAHFENKDISDAIKSHPIYRGKRKKTLMSQTDRAFHKLMQDFDFLNLDPKEFPKLYKAITDVDSKIPLSMFFRKDKEEQYFLLNDNFQLWEEMLKKHYAATVEIAQCVSTRSTYEKDLMSYFYFILYDLPEYLKKHTGEKWTCYPRLVDNPNDLEIKDEDDDRKGTEGEEGGTTIRKKRSALTPDVDNEKKTVTVPFASFRISGYQTQYCYSHSYHVLRRGFTYKGNTVLKDVQEKLNGRDDYGLMFYTLTGSETARGYPTFLIIFEKRKGGKETFVHFHRTHPSRSKNGDYNPVHRWIEVTYNWMCGNVKADQIKHQQGDLIFAQTPACEGVEFNDRVSFYDNHQFSDLVYFTPYDKKLKSNILGYAKIGEGITLLHHEHEHVPMEAGVYEVRQARSWEANPKGIWSLRID